MNTIDRRLIRHLLRNRARDEWREELHPRSKNGRFTSGGSSPAENTPVKELPTAKSAGFKPKTKSKYRNKRDEVVARHKALRKKQGLDGMPDCTVDPDTGDEVSFSGGYQVSFQTSISEQAGEGGVSDAEYDKITEELSRQTGSKPYIGVFDEAETSFHCKTYKEAMRIARKYNQQSILNWHALKKYADADWDDEEINKKIFLRNPDYDPSKNHVKGE